MSGEELTAALRRSRRRPGGHLDKQVSSDSQDLAETEAALERVRFDDNVSFIEAISPDSETDKHRPSKVGEIRFISRLLRCLYKAPSDAVRFDLFIKTGQNVFIPSPEL